MADPNSPSHPDHSGLEVVKNYDAPEVVSAEHDAPEVVTHATKPQSPYSDGPEAVYNPEHVLGAPYYAPPEKTSQYEHHTTNAQPYPYNGVGGGAYSPYQQPSTPFLHPDNATGTALSEHSGDAETALYTKREGAPGTASKDRRMCGMRRKVFFLIVGIIVVIIIVAAVVGGVVASKGSKSDDNSASSNATASASPLPSIYSSTGLGIDTLSGNSVTYSYYQEPQGRIIENAYSNGKWSIAGNVVPSTAVVAISARDGSPITSTTYKQNGVVTRQVFFINYSGQVMTTSTTGSSWSTPYSILTDDSASDNSIGLGVVSGTDAGALNGIRVYYPSRKGYIQECGMDFNKSVTTPVWNMWATFTADVDSGVASVLSAGSNHLYFRNSSTGGLQQWTWDYSDVSQWYIGESGPDTIVPGSGLAAANNGAGIDHIFYIANNNALTHALVGGSGFIDETTLATAADSSKLAATYYTASGSSQTGALVLFQPANNTKAMAYEVISDAGSVVLSGYA